jgi:hypothetical protein
LFTMSERLKAHCKEIKKSPAVTMVPDGSERRGPQV